MDDKKIGMNIKKYRKGKFTQQELADKVGKTESSIRKYEKGLVAIPLDVLDKIATALEVTIPDLMPDYFENTMQALHETNMFKQYLDILGYEVHESPYNDKWVIHIKDSDTDVYISSEEMNTLEQTTKENIDLRINKYMNDGKHYQ